MSKAQKKEVERSIEATLRDLNIDTDSTPEDAAQDAVQAMDQEEPSQNETKIQIPPPRGEDGPLDEEEEETPLPQDTLPSMPQGLVPSPQRGPKLRTKEIPKAAGKISKGLAEKMPGAEKVKVYKRKDDGQRWFVKEYTLSDLKNFPDFESFITKYIKPTHGAGEYDLVSVDSMNREAEYGQVRLMPEPNEKHADSGALALVERVLSEAQARDKEWLARMENTKQQDPLQLLTGVLNLTKQLDNEAGAGKQDVAKMVAESGNNTMQMFMAMMQQQAQQSQQQMQMMMGLLTRPKEEDPLMKIFMAKMLEEGVHGGGGAASPIPLPPPPQINILEVITAVAALMQSKKGDSDDFKDMLKTLLLKQQNEGLGIKDILQLVAEKRGGGDEFKSTIDNMAALMNVAQNLNRSEGSSSAGIWDALGALFGNRDFAGGIASAIRAKTDQSAGAIEARLKADAARIQMENRILEQKKRQLAEQINATPAPLAQARPRVRPVAAQPPMPVPEPLDEPKTSLEEIQRAAEQVVERTGALPQLPANTHDHLNGMNTAKDDADLVGKTVAMFMYFGEFPDWKGFVEAIFDNVRSGNKQKSLEYVVAFFEGLAQIGLIDVALGERVIKALSDHFVTLQKQFSDIVLETDSQVTADTLLAGAEEGAAAAE